MSLSQYELIQAINPEELEAAVNAAINAGKQPFGAPLAFPLAAIPTYFQAVCIDSGGGTPLPSDAVVVQDGDTVATNVVPGTASVVDGELTVNIPLGITATLVTDGQQLTGVAPSGAYTNTVTFTVSGGAITGIALS